MQENLSRRPDLLIVSDTAMWRLNGKLIAFEPVVREIEAFGHLFNRITWIGFEYDQKELRKNSREVNNLDVNFIFLKKTGGGGLLGKIKQLINLPLYIQIIFGQIRKSNVVHTRGPSVPALIAIIISFIDKKRKYWHKYAGNWNEPPQPFSYQLQRLLLKNAKNTTVTVNGQSQNHKHIFNIPNPTLTKEDIKAGELHCKTKNFDGPLNFCFVGRMKRAKGVFKILDAFRKIESPQIGEIHFIGDGSELEQLKREALEIDHKFVFHGFLNKDEINSIYRKSHFLLLPSDTEGFPKVAAEAINFGCIPIISDISCIGDYFTHMQNSFLWDVSTDFSTFFQSIDYKEINKLESMSNEAARLRNLFTYDNYINFIEQKILLKAH